MGRAYVELCGSNHQAGSPSFRQARLGTQAVELLGFRSLARTLVALEVMRRFRSRCLRELRGGPPQPARHMNLSDTGIRIAN